MNIKTFIKYIAALIFGVLVGLILIGCIPDIPEVPTGATCTQDGFVLRPVMHDPLDITTWEFVLEDDGSAMTCVFS